MGQLKQLPPPSDQDIDLENRVLRHLRTQHFSSFRKLMITADQGRVTVEGKVCSFYERQIAISAVQRVAGVIKVIDQILVTKSI